ncbi:MAG: transcriptional repressor [Rhizobiaceae bacterium]|nr:transcriptional repressor [Rhizobiaceae bacterium]
MASLFPDIKHQHRNCIESAISRAFRLAEDNGKKFGANQVRVLEALLQDHKAVSAYDIVDRINDTGKRLQAVQVYRALDSLMELGLVHRVQSANAYIACTIEDECRNPQLLFCSSCKRVAELASESISALISKTAKQSHFKLEQGLVELVGLCPDCVDA